MGTWFSVVMDGGWIDVGVPGSLCPPGAPGAQRVYPCIWVAILGLSMWIRCPGISCPLWDGGTGLGALGVLLACSSCVGCAPSGVICCSSLSVSSGEQWAHYLELATLDGWWWRSAAWHCLTHQHQLWSSVWFWLWSLVDAKQAFEVNITALCLAALALVWIQGLYQHTHSLTYTSAHHFTTHITPITACLEYLFVLSFDSLLVNLVLSVRRFEEVKKASQLRLSKRALSLTHMYKKN